MALNGEFIRRLSICLARTFSSNAAVTRHTSKFQIAVVESTTLKTKEKRQNLNKFTFVGGLRC